MTEQEAKALAAELAQHAIWYVTRVWEYSPFHWAIALARRSDHSKTATLYGNPGAEMLADILGDKLPPYLYQSS
jgi:hypothetical protein